MVNLKLYLVNIEKHLAGKDIDIFSKAGWDQKQS